MSLVCCMEPDRMLTNKRTIKESQMSLSSPIMCECSLEMISLFLLFYCLVECTLVIWNKLAFLLPYVSTQLYFTLNSFVLLGLNCFKCCDALYLIMVFVRCSNCNAFSCLVRCKCSLIGMYIVCWHWLLISAPRLGVYYFLSLTLSVCLSLCLSVCHGQTSNWFFFFVFRWNRASFWLSVLHVALYKTLFFDFWFRPPNTQNLLPKTACNNATLPRCHPWSRTRQFSSCLEKVGNPLNFRADPCCHDDEIWPRRGDLDAYRLVVASSLLGLLFNNSDY